MGVERKGIRIDPVVDDVGIGRPYVVRNPAVTTARNLDSRRAGFSK